VNVLFLVSDPSLGPDVPFGDSIRVRLLIDAVRELGHDVDVRWAGPAAAPTRVAPPPERAVPEWARQLVRDLRDLARSRAFRRRLDDVGRPDVVIEFASYLAAVGEPLARRLGVPYLVEVEGPLAQLRYEGGASGLRLLGDRLERRRLRAADALLTVSQPLAQHLVSQGARADRTHVLPNVVDRARFGTDERRRVETRRRLELDDRVVVGFHGVFSPWYGLDVLVESLAFVRDDRVSLLLVGDGVERDRVERIVAERSLADRVTITGFVSHDVVPEFVDAFDVAVVPDHVWWTSPLKLLEYGAMGKPVVAARVPSVEALAAPSEVALVERRDPEALAAAVDALVADDGRRALLAHRWEERVVHEHSYPQLVGRLGDVLDGLSP
jgi:glycosyltransferase involved in cell wall biosynthesis